MCVCVCSSKFFNLQNIVSQFRPQQGWCVCVRTLPYLANVSDQVRGHTVRVALSCVWVSTNISTWYVCLLLLLCLCQCCPAQSSTHTHEPVCPLHHRCVHCVLGANSVCLCLCHLLLLHLCLFQLQCVVTMDCFCVCGDPSAVMRM